jgi:hypothetical protein
MTRREAFTRLGCLVGLIILGLVAAHVSYLMGGF